MINFKILSVVTAFICFVLCITLMFYPEIIFLLFDIEQNNSAFFICRRSAILFLGVSVYTWSGRSAAHSQSRQAICIGLAVSMFALALLGMAEYNRGYVSSGIMLAVITESVLAFFYFKIWLSCREKQAF